MLKIHASLNYYKIWIVIQAAFVMAWMSNLANTDALYSIYALCGIMCVFCMADNFHHQRMKPDHGVISVVLMAMLFSSVTFLANYNQFCKVWYMNSLSYPTNIIRNGVNSVCSLIGGYFVAYQILLYILANFPVLVSDKQEQKWSWKVFFFVFLSVAFIDLVYLFLDEYPGHITPDSLYQIEQGYYGNYINDHPFWHTFLLKCILDVGYAIFGSPNGAVALYSVLQILFAASCFAYAIATLYQLRVPNLAIAAIYAIYTFMPYNIVYSITLWKDIPFGLAFLLLAVSLYRLLSGIGKKQIYNYLVFVIGALSVCICRTNGLAVFAVFALFLIPYLSKRNKKLIVIILVILILAWLLTGPVLTWLEVGQAHISEAFCLPLQQMARVIYEGCPLNESQTELLSKIFSIEDIPEIYTEWYADPIKIELHENDYTYFTEHLLEYAKLWVELGIEYPLEYLKAWIEQTKGYWNGGYSYHQYVEMMQPNDYGLTKTSGNNLIAKLIDLYFGASRQVVFFEPFNSIGLHVWLLVLCCYLNVRNKRIEWLLCIPGLVIIAGLLLGTPVFCEFRYAYPVFTTIPFIAAVSFCRTSGKSKI